MLIYIGIGAFWVVEIILSEELIQREFRLILFVIGK